MRFRRKDGGVAHRIIHGGSRVGPGAGHCSAQARLLGSRTAPRECGTLPLLWGSQGAGPQQTFTGRIRVGVTPRLCPAVGRSAQLGRRCAGALPRGLLASLRGGLLEALLGLRRWPENRPGRPPAPRSVSEDYRGAEGCGGRSYPRGHEGPSTMQGETDLCAGSSQGGACRDLEALEETAL